MLIDSLEGGRHAEGNVIKNDRPRWPWRSLCGSEPRGPKGERRSAARHPYPVGERGIERSPISKTTRGKARRRDCILRSGREVFYAETAGIDCPCRRLELVSPRGVAIVVAGPLRETVLVKRRLA